MGDNIPTVINPAHYSGGRKAKGGEGPASAMPAVEGKIVQHPQAGSVLRISGIQQFYEREAVFIEDDKRYFLFATVVDSSKVVFGIRWLDANLLNVGSAMLCKPPADTFRIEAGGYVSRNGLCEGDIIPPPSAVYMRVKIRTVGVGDVFIVALGHRSA